MAPPRAEIRSAEGMVLLDVCVTEVHTAADRAAGLRGRSLSPDEGLVIRFPVEGEVCIVNTGVPYAIDVVFASSEGTVLEVLDRLPAGDDAARCVGGVLRVLEIVGGTAGAVQVGDRLVVDA